MSEAEPDLSGRANLLALLAWLNGKADTALSSGKLMPSDARQLRIGRGRMEEIAAVLDMIKDRLKDAPYAFEVSSRLNALLGTALSGAFLIGERSTITRSAQAHIVKSRKKEQTAKARISQGARKAASRAEDIEKARPLILSAERKLDGSLKHFGTTLEKVRKHLGRDVLDPKTFRGWVDEVEKTREV